MKKKIVSIVMCMVLGLSLIGCGAKSESKDNLEAESVTEQTEDVNVSLAEKYNATDIALSDEQILVNGEVISTDSSDAVYQANDIVFYLEGQDFTYGEGTKEDEHSQEEADAHTVVHITKPGNYVVSGKLSAGQIAVDLGEDAKKDSEAVVTLILSGVDITCNVAPGVIFYNVYECGDDDAENATKDVDTSSAGANVIIADDSTNYVSGSYVARIYESVELNEAGTEVIDSKKLHKYDAAFYSKRTMNVTGEEKGTGVLNIQAVNEGLGSELHLTVNGGIININSGNDGINTNEDGVSLTTVNGGNLNIVVNGSTGEGDGIDSNGWLVINGGTVTAAACGFSADAGIDSDMGIHINGGTVIATGNMLDEIAESDQTYAVFSSMESIKGGTTVVLKNEAEENVAEYTPENDFSYLIISTENLLPGTYTLWKDDVQLSVMEMSGRMPGMMGGGMKNPGGEPPQMPEGERPQRPEEVPVFEEEHIVPEGNPMMKPEGDWTELEERPRGEGMQPPQGGIPEFSGGDIKNAEVSTEFSIKEGSNMFLIVE